MKLIEINRRNKYSLQFQGLTAALFLCDYKGFAVFISIRRKLEPKMDQSVNRSTINETFFFQQFSV
ncbi:hypothetical protein AAK943_13190 [Emergencia timonensis]|uniref:hypothetical protein n=1 Tax=Emergencia timonensis TaxID=1776384 RepID=UPI001A9A6101|nr:hypothetical protein [Emergencia timonensis]